MTRGVVLYNKGKKMGVRIAVCMHTLNRHWDGPVTLVHDGEDGWQMAKALCRRFGVALKLADWPVKLDCKNATLLNKCQIHTQVDYDVGCLIDTDCIVCGDLSPMFFNAEKSEFAVARFSDWKTRGRKRLGKIGKRISQWRGILPDTLVDDALDYGYAINTGVYAWRKDSQLMRDWLGFAKKGCENFIPDETCCQVMLAHYPHQLMQSRFNVSCRYGSEADFRDAVVIHQHGRKHCRFNEDGTFRYNSHLWYEQFEKVRNEPCVKGLIKHDRMLKKYLPQWDKVKGKI